MSDSALQDFMSQEYQYGFRTEIESDEAPFGLNEDIIALISSRKNEPEYMLEFRLKAYKHWKTMTQPHWSRADIEPIDFDKLRYYSAPKKKNAPSRASLDEVDPEILAVFDKLGIPLSEQKRLSNVAVDAVFDSTSVATTHQKYLAKFGIIFCSISEAIKEHPELIKKYLGSVVPYGDNFYAALNSAVFTDGSFCFIPKGVKCPMDLSTYFRINAVDTGQFERTLIIAEEDSFVNYIEGCTAPQFSSHQLHAAIVEIVTLDNAVVNYSTVQNWFPGDKDGSGGVYNLVTKRGLCKGSNSKITWTQIEVGSAVTWKYPSVILKGDGSRGEFYSVALTNHKMQADTGTKMIHIGKNTSSYIVSKGISAGESRNVYRGLVEFKKSASNSKNFTQCDSMLIGDKCSAVTYPYIEMKNSTSQIAHEATTSQISAEQIFYLQSRGLSQEQAVSYILNGFCQEVFKKLPAEFSVEAVRLLELKLEDSIG
ncbi:MAG: Fe-S cluster assembly protein SufB [Brevinemataceae bacterium]